MHRSVFKFSLIPSLAFALTTACTPAAVLPTAAVFVSPTPPTLPTATAFPPTVEPTPTQLPATATTVPTSIDPPAVGNLLFSNAIPSEGYIVVPAGDALFVTWDNAPSGGSRYEFTLYPHDDSAPLLIGVDEDVSDGVSVLWLVPSQLTGFARATAYLPDGTTVSSLSEAIATTATTVPISNDPPAIGSILFPIVMGDGGHVAIQAGATLSFTWDQAPSGGSRYEFYWHHYADLAPILLGVDNDASDGVRVLWQVPPQLRGYIQATAYFPDGTTISQRNGDHIFTGEAPPPGICTLRITSIYPANVALEPQANSPIFGQFSSGYVPVLGYTAEGWYQVDVTNIDIEIPSIKVPSESLTPPPLVTIQPMPTSGWLSPETMFERFGPCEALPLIEN